MEQVIDPPGAPGTGNSPHLSWQKRMGLLLQGRSLVEEALPVVSPDTASAGRQHFGPNAASTDFLY
jgi:hypothetical protein